MGTQDAFRLGKVLLIKDWDRSGKNDLRSARFASQIICCLHVDRAAESTPNCFDRIGGGMKEAGDRRWGEGSVVRTCVECESF